MHGLAHTPLLSYWLSLALPTEHRWWSSNWAIHSKRQGWVVNATSSVPYLWYCTWQWVQVNLYPPILLGGLWSFASVSPHPLGSFPIWHPKCKWDNNLWMIFLQDTEEKCQSSDAEPCTTRPDPIPQERTGGQKLTLHPCITLPEDNRKFLCQEMVMGGGNWCGRVRGAEVWNENPSQVQSSQSVSVFLIVAMGISKSENFSNLFYSVCIRM